MNSSANNLHFFVAFLGGIAISFTPCVYPLIPVVISVVTASSFGSKIKGFLLSLVFVSGTAVTYAALGLIATLTSRHFGRVSSHPISHLLVGIIVFVFGLHMLDLIKIHIPTFLHIKHTTKKNGILAIFFMGLISGLAVGPCTAPALGSILTFAGKRQNLLYSIFLLMSFAYGMGLILILAGTFSSLLANIPKPGPWLGRVKKILGLILMLWAAYFIYSGLRRIW